MPSEASPSAVVMLGIDGVRVFGARDVDGEVELTVETTTDRDWCRSCGLRAHSKCRPVVVVRDVDAFGRRARVRWIKRRWRCPEPACPIRSWTGAARWRAAVAQCPGRAPIDRVGGRVVHLGRPAQNLYRVQGIERCDLLNRPLFRGDLREVSVLAYLLIKGVMTPHASCTERELVGI